MVYSKEAVKFVGDIPKNILEEDVQQLYPDTCAIKSQQIILKDFGIDVTEDQLRNEAIMNGWYNGNGTNPYDVGNLLELHGVPVTQYENANIFNIVNELAQGHKVIVGVDSGELWNNDVMDMLFEDNAADHALIVSGVDTTDPNDVKVLLTDPGTGDLMKEYAMDDFVDAWQDSNCFMVTTDIAEPNIFDSFADINGLNYPVTNLPYVGDMPYDLFSDNFAYLNYTDTIPTSVFDDFSDYVGGDIDMFSSETLDYLNLI